MRVTEGDTSEERFLYQWESDWVVFCSNRLYSLLFKVFFGGTQMVIGLYDLAEGL